MTGAEQSLLAFLETPVIVGDPEGRAAYVNPAFEACFALSRESVVGRSLAELFEGGGREAVLRAVAEVCQYGESVRFRVREREIGFAAVASPIVAQDARVGVVILLKEEVEGMERLLALRRELADPLDELADALECLTEQTGGRRDERYAGQVEEAIEALGRLRKWSDQLDSVLAIGSGHEAATAGVDPARLVRNVAQRIGRDASEVGAQVELLAPSSLPGAVAHGKQLEAVLVRLVKERLTGPTPPATIFLSARSVQGTEGEGAGSVLFCVTERHAGPSPADRSAPALAKEVVAACGGAIHVTADPDIGRATVVRVPALAG